MWKAYSILVGKPEGKKLLGRPRHRWESNVKMDLFGCRLLAGFIWLRMGFLLADYCEHS
jgi:hypothetical protein